MQILPATGPTMFIACVAWRFKQFKRSLSRLPRFLRLQCTTLIKVGIFEKLDTLDTHPVHFAESKAWLLLYARLPAD